MKNSYEFKPEYESVCYRINKSCDPYIPHKRAGVSGKYQLIKDIDASFKSGYVTDSNDGMVHGIWNSKLKKTVFFDDVKWFRPHVELTQEYVDELTRN